MNKLFSSFAVPMAIVFLAVPSLAQVAAETGMDVSDMTCGDLRAMDHDQMVAVSIEAMKMASMSDHERAEMAAMVREERLKSQSAQAEMGAMTDDKKAEYTKKTNEARVKLMAACGSDDSMMIMDAAKAVAKD